MAERQRLSNHNRYYTASCGRLRRWDKGTQSEILVDEIDGTLGSISMGRDEGNAKLDPFDYMEVVIVDGAVDPPLMQRVKITHNSVTALWMFASRIHAFKPGDPIQLRVFGSEGMDIKHAGKHTFISLDRQVVNPETGEVTWQLVEKTEFPKDRVEKYAKAMQVIRSHPAYVRTAWDDERPVEADEEQNVIAVTVGNTEHRIPDEYLAVIASIGLPAPVSATDELHLGPINTFFASVGRKFSNLNEISDADWSIWTQWVSDRSAPNNHRKLPPSWRKLIEERQAADLPNDFDPFAEA